MTSHRPEDIPPSARVTMHRDEPDEELPPLLYYATCISRGSDPTAWADERGSDYWLDPQGRQALPVGSVPEPPPKSEPAYKYAVIKEFHEEFKFQRPDEYTPQVAAVRTMSDIDRPTPTAVAPPIQPGDLPTQIFPIVPYPIPPELDFAMLRKRHPLGGST